MVEIANKVYSMCGGKQITCF